MHEAACMHEARTRTRQQLAAVEELRTTTNIISPSTPADKLIDEKEAQELGLGSACDPRPGSSIDNSSSIASSKGVEHAFQSSFDRPQIGLEFVVVQFRRRFSGPFPLRVRVLQCSTSPASRMLSGGMRTRTTSSSLYQRAISYSPKASGCRVLLDDTTIASASRCLNTHCDDGPRAAPTAATTSYYRPVASIFVTDTIASFSSLSLSRCLLFCLLIGSFFEAIFHCLGRGPFSRYGRLSDHLDAVVAGLRMEQRAASSQHNGVHACMYDRFGPDRKDWLMC